MPVYLDHNFKVSRPPTIFNQQYKVMALSTKEKFEAKNQRNLRGKKIVPINQDTQVNLPRLPSSAGDLIVEEVRLPRLHNQSPQNKDLATLSSKPDS
jgi:hypothetical protein